VIWGGMSHDFKQFEILNVGYKQDGNSTEIIKFDYYGYIEALISSCDHALIKTVDQLKILNDRLTTELFG
jgi:hypothetical protein